jgi:AcrR family transcriptional regulator
MGRVEEQAEIPPTPAESPARDRLLQDAIAYVAGHGLADLSLRQLAAAIGTSHRMLIYHFGSKEGLVVAVIRAVEQEQRDRLAALEFDPTLSPAEMARRMWRHLSDPALWPNERLFYEMYGHALQARFAGAGDFLREIVESWLEPLAATHRARGIPADAAQAQARLDVAMTRGLLLDLLATGDRAATDAAVEQAIALYDAWRANVNPAPS